MSECYVGLMSGTSMDGIDAVVVSFDDDRVKLLATHSQDYPPEMRAALLAEIRKPLDVAIDEDGALHRAVGECFRDAANQVIAKSGRARIAAIGSHGQTMRHCPDADEPFSLQIGDADLIARGTGTETIANFRAADIAAGGQGAPLVPAFHRWLFRSPDIHRVVVNIGGIANITVLPAGSGDVTGFDTGPGNGLMDAWMRANTDELYDDCGRLADSGNVVKPLLESFLADPYFALSAPKSTGFEYFNIDWLNRFPVADAPLADVQSTLCELTAVSIANAVRSAAPDTSEVFVCGGGVHNDSLMRRLARNLPETEVQSTSVLGLDPGWVEACAFAWLARATQNGEPGNVPSVTGAKEPVTLGEIHSPE